MCPKCNRAYDQDIKTCEYCNCILIENYIQNKNYYQTFKASNELNTLKNSIFVYLITVILSIFALPFTIFGVLVLANGIYNYNNKYPTPYGKLLTVN